MSVKLTASSRGCYILAWKLCTTMAATDVSDTLQAALQASGLDQVKVLHRPREVVEHGGQVEPAPADDLEGRVKSVCQSWLGAVVGSAKRFIRSTWPLVRWLGLVKRCSISCSRQTLYVVRAFRT